MKLAQVASTLVLLVMVGGAGFGVGRWVEKETGPDLAVETRAAYDQGFAGGKAASYDEGSPGSYADGQADGHRDGYAEGKADLCWELADALVKAGNTAGPPVADYCDKAFGGR